MPLSSSVASCDAFDCADALMLGGSGGGLTALEARLSPVSSCSCRYALFLRPECSCALLDVDTGVLPGGGGDKKSDATDAGVAN